MPDQPQDDPVCRAPGRDPALGHSWQRKWKVQFSVPSYPTEEKICGLCHMTSKVPWMPKTDDLDAISEWLDAPV